MLSSSGVEVDVLGFAEKVWSWVCVVLSGVWLCDCRDGSPPGSPVPGILWARTLERAAMPASRGIFPTQGLNTRGLHLLHCRHVLYYWPPGNPCIYVTPQYAGTSFEVLDAPRRMPITLVSSFFVCLFEKNGLGCVELPFQTPSFMSQRIYVRFVIECRVEIKILRITLWFWCGRYSHEFRYFCYWKASSQPEMMLFDTHLILMILSPLIFCLFVS